MPDTGVPVARRLPVGIRSEPSGPSWNAQRLSPCGRYRNLIRFGCRRRAITDLYGGRCYGGGCRKRRSSERAAVTAAAALAAVAAAIPSLTTSFLVACSIIAMRCCVMMERGVWFANYGISRPTLHCSEDMRACLRAGAAFLRTRGRHAVRKSDVVDQSLKLSQVKTWPASCKLIPNGVRFTCCAFQLRIVHSEIRRT